MTTAAAISGPAAVTARPGYVDHLLIVRGLCALGVLGIHALFYFPGRDALPPLGPVMSLILPRGGEMFVYVFFVLSGYLMGKLFHSGKYQLTRRGIGRFYRNRFLRIAPLLYVNLLACLLLLPGRAAVWPEHWLSVTADFLFFNNLTHKVINPVTWSLSYEMQDYLICPLFAALFVPGSGRTLRRALGVLLLLLAYSYVSQHYLDGWHLLKRLVGLGRYTWFFFSGYLVCLLLPRLAARGWHGAFGVRLGGYAAFATGCLLFTIATNMSASFTAQVALQIAVMLALMLLELPGGQPDTGGLTPVVVAGRILTWTGIVSYGLYLWHLPCIELLRLLPGESGEWFGTPATLHLPPAVAAAWFAAAVLLVSGAVSLFTFFAVERVFRPGLYDFRDSRILAGLLRSGPVMQGRH